MRCGGRAGRRLIGPDDPGTVEGKSGLVTVRMTSGLGKGFGAEPPLACRRAVVVDAAALHALV